MTRPCLFKYAMQDDQGVQQNLYPRNKRRELQLFNKLGILSNQGQLQV